MAAASQAIQGADFDDPDSISAVESVRFTPAGEQAARDILSSGASGAALWAATWVYASSAKDPAPLRPLLDNGNASVRVLAAAGAMAMGERAGFATLQRSLLDSKQLDGAHPAVSIGAFALSTVQRYVQAPDAPAAPESEDQLAAAAQTWVDWLGRHAGNLQFETSTGTWKLP